MPEEPEPSPEEWLEIEAADAYLDAVGNRRDFEGDELGATEWRDDVDAEPINMSQFPSAIPGGATPPFTTGGMLSIQENAAQIGQMSQDETAQGMLGSAKQHLDDAVAALAGASDHVAQTAGQAGQLLGGAEGDHIVGQGQQVTDELNNLIGQIQAAKGATDDAIRFANAFNTALRNAAQKHGGF